MDREEIIEALTQTFYFDNRTRGTGPQDHDAIRAELEEKSDDELQALWKANSPRTRLDSN